MPKAEHRYIELLLASALLAGACAGVQATSSSAAAPGNAPPSSAAPIHAEVSCPSQPLAVSEVRPLVDEYCVSCHSPNGAAGEDYDFRSDAAVTARRRNIEAKLRLHVMPPPTARQPSEAERLALRCWAKG